MGRVGRVGRENESPIFFSKYVHIFTLPYMYEYRLWDLWDKRESRIISEVCTYLGIIGIYMYYKAVGRVGREKRV